MRPKNLEAEAILREEAKRRATHRTAKQLAELTGFTASYCAKRLSQFRREQRSKS